MRRVAQSVLLATMTALGACSADGPTEPGIPMRASVRFVNSDALRRTRIPPTPAIFSAVASPPKRATAMRPMPIPMACRISVKRT